MVFGFATLTLANCGKVSIYKHFSMHRNFKMTFGTQKAPTFWGLNATYGSIVKGISQNASNVLLRVRILLEPPVIIKIK